MSVRIQPKRDDNTNAGSLGVSLGSRRVEGVTVPVSAGVSELDSLRQVRIGCKKVPSKLKDLPFEQGASGGRLTDKVSPEGDQVFWELLRMLRRALRVPASSGHELGLAPTLLLHDLPERLYAVLLIIPRWVRLRVPSDPTLDDVHVSEVRPGGHEFFGPGDKGLVWVGFPHALEGGEGGETDGELVGWVNGGEGLHDFEGESHAVLDGASVLVGSLAMREEDDKVRKSIIEGYLIGPTYLDTLWRNWSMK
jgi:hypothetical protein